MNYDFQRRKREILRTIDEAEVVCIIFSNFGQSLIFDSRYTAEEPPRIAVSPPVGSGERWLRQLNQARPHLPRAKEMATLPWVGSVASMVHAGIWERIVTRMVIAGFSSAEASCKAALDEVLEWEYRATIAMVRGEGPFQTIWSRRGD